MHIILLIFSYFPKTWYVFENTCSNGSIQIGADTENDECLQKTKRIKFSKTYLPH